eukprot:TRINITY_DN93780_c0_g1_i1.p1 TRINITY_DN93780_c0_g1~~TRINITY_DN93780_c0_g1_i1.p1  ORF type:complete len:309 (-),score=70.93 TRINITY_DN93780_c0_g1_i1:118-1044(-)
MVEAGSEVKIDNGRWEADCDAAFEIALPKKWEFRDRGWGSSNSWRPLPDALGNEINAMARRGQRRGNVSAGGAELMVDLADMVAVPADQSQGYVVPKMLRSTPQQCRLNKQGLKKFYTRYAEPVDPADHPAGPDGVAGQRFLALFQDISVDPATDVAALALSAACIAQEMGVFRRREFICGCAALQVNSVEDLRAKMPELRENVMNGKTLPEVYQYTFGVALEPPSKVLPVDQAVGYWELLLHQWPLNQSFCEWAIGSMKGKAVNRDMWMMVLKLATEVPADLSTYDDNPAWPVALDEFVEYYRGQKA